MKKNIKINIEWILVKIDFQKDFERINFIFIIRVLGN